MFHGSVAISVDILQKAADESTKGSVARELLSLVAMTVAGFPTEGRDPNGNQQVWRKMATTLCKTLWEAAHAQKMRVAEVLVAKETQQSRDDSSLKNGSVLSSTGHSGDSSTLSARSILYLRALLSFLCSPAGWIPSRNKRTYFRQQQEQQQQQESNIVGGMSKRMPQTHQIFGSGISGEFGGYDALLNPNVTFDYEGTGIRICDQVGFAVIYLPDGALQKYLNILTNGVIDNGDVAGLLLTGSSPKACPMFQQYIDNTNDLQSVVLLACSMGMTDSGSGNIGGSSSGSSGSSGSSDSSGSSGSSEKDHPKKSGNSSSWMNGRTGGRFQEWIQLYREMLNRHQLWLERAKFDVARSRKLKQLEKERKQEQKETQKEQNTELSMSEKDAVRFIQRPQVAARCNHCKASFQLSDLLADASIRRSDWLAKQPAKMLSCPLPKCKKALPRCSICLLPMTVQNPFLYLSKTGHETTSTKKKETSWAGTNPYSEWFVWCQTCHHGGHTACLSDWFRRHPKCPVSNCSCVCSMLD